MATLETQPKSAKLRQLLGCQQPYDDWCQTQSQPRGINLKLMIQPIVHISKNSQNQPKQQISKYSFLYPFLIQGNRPLLNTQARISYCCI